jgi:hypothetical protein
MSDWIQDLCAFIHGIDGYSYGTSSPQQYKVMTGEGNSMTVFGKGAKDGPRGIYSPENRSITLISSTHFVSLLKSVN